MHSGEFRSEFWSWFTDLNRINAVCKHVCVFQFGGERVRVRLHLDKMLFNIFITSEDTCRYWRWCLVLLRNDNKIVKYVLGIDERLVSCVCARDVRNIGQEFPDRVV